MPHWLQQTRQLLRKAYFRFSSSRLVPAQVLTQETVTDYTRSYLIRSIGRDSPTFLLTQVHMFATVCAAGVCRGMHNLSEFVPSYPFDSPRRPLRNEGPTQVPSLRYPALTCTNRTRRKTSGSRGSRGSPPVTALLRGNYALRRLARMRSLICSR